MLTPPKPPPPNRPSRPPVFARLLAALPLPLPFLPPPSALLSLSLPLGDVRVVLK